MSSVPKKANKLNLSLSLSLVTSSAITHYLTNASLFPAEHSRITSYKILVIQGSAFEKVFNKMRTIFVLVLAN